jgi:hypothetical protein
MACKPWPRLAVILVFQAVRAHIILRVSMYRAAGSTEQARARLDSTKACIDRVTPLPAWILTAAELLANVTRRRQGRGHIDVPSARNGHCSRRACVRGAVVVWQKRIAVERRVMYPYRRRRAG